MQNDQLKSRLNSLKKASIQLKAKVINQPKINYQGINEIIANIIPNKDGEYHLANSNQSYQRNSQGIEMAMTVSKVFSNSGKEKASNTSPVSPTNSLGVPQVVGGNSSSPTQISISPPQKQADKSSWRQRSSSNDSGFSRDPLDSQIQKLKIQNDQIQLQLQTLSQQIRQIHKKQIIKQEQSWKDNLPFINIQSNIGIFITKLFIKEYDYDKIDYQDGKIYIIADKLLINLSMKAQREYKLINLGEIKYIGDNTMKIQFKNQQTVFMFLIFDHIRKRDQFDLALFVNHKIITDKDLDRMLFVEMREKQDITSQILKTSKHSTKRQDSQERYIDYRLGGGGDKTDRLRKNSSKISEKWKVKGSNVSSRSQASSLRRQDSFRNLNGIQYTLNGTSFQNNDIQSPPAAFGQDNQKAFQDIVVFGNGLAQSNNQVRHNTSRFNTNQLNFAQFQTQAQAPEQPIHTPLISSQKIQQQRQQIKYESIIKQLKQGYFFTKYAKDGSKPHNKKVFISSDQKYLVSMSTSDPDDKKVIPIQNIKQIRYPDIDEGIKKFVTTQICQNYCVIQYELDGKNKVMELGCYSLKKLMPKFVEELTEFLKKKFIIND